MAPIDDLIPEQDAMLARFAQMSLELAQALQARALKAEDDKVMCDLTRAFQGAGRAMRQSMALRLKLRRDGLRLNKLEEVRTRLEAWRASGARRDALTGRVVEALADAGDDETIERLDDDLELMVFQESRKADFLDADLDLMARDIGRRLQALAGQAREPEPPKASPPPEPRPVQEHFRDPIPDPALDLNPTEPEDPPPKPELPPAPAQAADYDFLDRFIERSASRGTDGPWRSG